MGDQTPVSELTPFQVDNLLLLIGANPLPNYVAAHLLARDRATTKIMLVCSKDTRDEAAKRLKERLTADGFDKIEYCEVEEANPPDIRNKVTALIPALSGSIGLHYTGGTKAMSVHAYLALQEQADNRTQYSYLDARRLQLQIETSGALRTIPDVGRLLLHPLTIRVLLEMHDLDKFKKKMQATPLWPDAASVLAELYTDVIKSTAWREWCKGTMRELDKKDRLQLKETKKLGEIRIGHIPDSAVQEAFLALYPTYTLETAFTTLAQAVGIKNSSDDLAKWFDGEWLEHYVLHTLKPLKDSGVLHDLVMTINPDLTETDFEFDVAGIRGYQLFAFSVSTTSEKGLLKSKLLEAVVRAEQMGGSEARVALVCYASPKDVQKLEGEINTLFRQRQLTKIFGRDDLLDLHAKVEHWVNTSKGGA